MSKPTLLIVDDDPLIAESVSYFLGKDFAIHSASSRSSAVAIARHLPALDLALVDLGLPPNPHRPDEGFRLIRDLLAHASDIRILVLSGQTDDRNARHARALGAADFIGKPADPHVLRERLLELLSLPDTTTGTLLGNSPPMRQLKALIRQYAESPFPALITGESGSGKEVIAREIHFQSSRRDQPMLALNCAAISPALVEATLFGHIKGAFTGAQQGQPGYFEEAGEGTLFLDEIGEMPLELQPKLLRVLENGEYQRIGDPHPRQSKARVIAATNRDLREEVKAGRFRSDLYHRLTVFTLTAPPLRDLDEDRMLLLDHYAEIHASQAGTPAFTLSARAKERWRKYAFPGNVRELRNILLRLQAKYPAHEVGIEELEAELDLNFNLGSTAEEGLSPAPLLADIAMATLKESGDIELDHILKEWERAYIESALALTSGNMAQASRMLGLNRTTLYNRIESLRRTNNSNDQEG